MPEKRSGDILDFRTGKRRSTPPPLPRRRVEATPMAEDLVGLWRNWERGAMRRRVSEIADTRRP